MDDPPRSERSFQSKQWTRIAAAGGVKRIDSLLLLMMMMIIALLIVPLLLLLLIHYQSGTSERSTRSNVVDPDRCFRCCCNQRLIELLSSIADAPAVAADRSTDVVAAAGVVGVVAATDSEL